MEEATSEKPGNRRAWLALAGILLVLIVGGFFARAWLNHEHPHFGVDVGMTFDEVSALLKNPPRKITDAWASIADDTHFGLWLDGPPRDPKAVKIKLREWVVADEQGILYVAFDQDDKVLARNDTRQSVFREALSRVGDLRFLFGR